MSLSRLCGRRSGCEAAVPDADAAHRNGRAGVRDVRERECPLAAALHLDDGHLPTIAPRRPQEGAGEGLKDEHGQPLAYGAPPPLSLRGPFETERLGAIATTPIETTAL